MYVVAIKVRFGENHAERFTDLSPGDAHRLEHPLRNDLASVLRYEHEVRVQAVNAVRRDAESLSFGHAAE